jgi:hypothetical protein
MNGEVAAGEIFFFFVYRSNVSHGVEALWRCNENTRKSAA